MPHPFATFPQMPALSSEQAKAMQAKRIRRGPRNARKEILELQSLLLRDIRKDKLSPAIRAKCVIAFDKLEDRLRILAGKPLPGQLRPDGWNPFVKPRKPKPSPAVLPLPDVDNHPLTEGEAVNAPPA
jgi:hypothetical protein